MHRPRPAAPAAPAASAALLAFFALAGAAPIAPWAGAPVLHAQGVDALPTIQVNSTVEGALGPESPESLNWGRFRAYRFEGQADTRYAIDARSGDFDAYLVLAHAVGGITEILREDDDGGEGTDARIVLTLDRSGTYVLIVRAWGSEPFGRFTLSLEERDVPPPVAARPLSPGQPVQGRLDPELGLCTNDWDDEFPCDFWTLPVTEGDLFLVSMESDDLDSYLDVGMLDDGGELLVHESDDDGGEGLNALLVFRAPSTGTMGVRPSVWGFASGAYTLRVDPVEPLPPFRGSLRIGELVRGEIRPGEARLTGLERGFQAWTFEGRAGDRLRIRMRSDAFDTYLSLGRENARGDYEELAANDDAPDDGLNSLIEITLPTDGTYVLHASPLSDRGSGPYTLEIVREGG